jgi:hypothetical protein
MEYGTLLPLFRHHESHPCTGEGFWTLPLPAKLREAGKSVRKMLYAHAKMSPR